MSTFNWCLGRKEARRNSGICVVRVRRSAIKVAVSIQDEFVAIRDPSNYHFVA